MDDTAFLLEIKQHVYVCIYLHKYFFKLFGMTLRETETGESAFY